MVYYYEHYPHYMGTLNAELEIPDDTFDELLVLADQIIKHKKEDDYEKFDEIVSELAKKQDEQTVYALDNALYDFGNKKRIKEIKKKLEKKGLWSDQWEEGSHALSTKSMKQARKAVGKIEATLIEDEFDY